MSPRSSAYEVSYNLRPSKKCERKLMLESLSVAAECGFPIKDYRYVGMGANTFYDFVLMHKYFGIEKMISLEHDAGMMKRACFNNSYKFIQVLQRTASEFVHEDEFSGTRVYWMDYDGEIKPDIVRDIATLGAKANVGDFVFVTVRAGLPRWSQKHSTKQRLL